mgnify:CR=1 FL=1
MSSEGPRNSKREKKFEDAVKLVSRATSVGAESQQRASDTAPPSSSSAAVHDWMMNWQKSPATSPDFNSADFSVDKSVAEKIREKKEWNKKLKAAPADSGPRDQPKVRASVTDILASDSDADSDSEDELDQRKSSPAVLGKPGLKRTSSDDAQARQRGSVKIRLSDLMGGGLDYEEEEDSEEEDDADQDYGKKMIEFLKINVNSESQCDNSRGSQGSTDSKKMQKQNSSSNLTQEKGIRNRLAFRMGLDRARSERGLGSISYAKKKDSLSLFIPVMGRSSSLADVLKPPTMKRGTTEGSSPNLSGRSHARKHGGGLDSKSEHVHTSTRRGGLNGTPPSSRESSPVIRKSAGTRPTSRESSPSYDWRKHTGSRESSPVEPRQRSSRDESKPAGRPKLSSRSPSRRNVSLRPSASRSPSRRNLNKPPALSREASKCSPSPERKSKGKDDLEGMAALPMPPTLDRGVSAGGPKQRRGHIDINTDRLPRSMRLGLEKSLSCKGIGQSGEGKDTLRRNKSGGGDDLTHRMKKSRPKHVEDDSPRGRKSSGLKQRRARRDASEGEVRDQSGSPSGSPAKAGHRRKDRRDHSADEDGQDTSECPNRGADKHDEGERRQRRERDRRRRGPRAAPARARSHSPARKANHHDIVRSQYEHVLKNYNPDEVQAIYVEQPENPTEEELAAAEAAGKEAEKAAEGTTMKSLMSFAMKATTATMKTATNATVATAGIAAKATTATMKTATSATVATAGMAAKATTAATNATKKTTMTGLNVAMTSANAVAKTTTSAATKSAQVGFTVASSTAKTAAKAMSLGASSHHKVSQQPEGESGALSDSDTGTHQIRANRGAVATSLSELVGGGLGEASSEFDDGFPAYDDDEGGLF